MAEYIEIEQLWKCETCYHNDRHGCTFGLGCDHGESYRPAYGKLKKADVVPVVHGSWRSVGLAAVKCSECGYVDDWKMYHRYCPDCGAFMR